MKQRELKTEGVRERERGIVRVPHHFWAVLNDDFGRRSRGDADANKLLIALPRKTHFSLPWGTTYETQPGHTHRLCAVLQNTCTQTHTHTHKNVLWKDLTHIMWGKSSKNGQ